MKTLLFACSLWTAIGILPLTAGAQASEGAAAPLLEENAPTRTEWLMGASYLRWNERLRLQRNALLDTDTANFSGLNLNVEYQILYRRWGMGTGFSFGGGRANGGGNSTVVAYTRNNEAWTSFGAMAKVFYRWAPRVSFAVTMPLILRQISWLSPDGVTEANSGQNINLGVLLGIGIRLNKNLDFVQELGALNTQGSTLWRVGLQVRL